MEHGPTFSCIGDLYPNLPTHTLTHGHHTTTCCKMAELTELAVHTTRKYHQFDLSRTDGIFDGSQVSGVLLKGIFCVRFWTRFGKKHNFERLSLQTACAIFACLKLWEGSSWNISSLFKSMCFCPKARTFTVTTVWLFSALSLEYLKIMDLLYCREGALQRACILTTQNYGLT